MLPVDLDFLEGVDRSPSVGAIAWALVACAFAPFFACRLNIRSACSPVREGKRAREPYGALTLTHVDL